MAFVYAPDRKAERPIAHLDGFQRILQVDGYAGYLTDVLTRIVNGHPNRDIDALLPWAYKTQDLRAGA